MDIISIVVFVFVVVAFVSAKIKAGKSEEYTEYIYKNGIIYDTDGVRVGIYFKRMMVLNGKTIDFAHKRNFDIHGNEWLVKGNRCFIDSGVFFSKKLNVILLENLIEGFSGG